MKVIIELFYKLIRIAARQETEYGRAKDINHYLIDENLCNFF